MTWNFETDPDFQEQLDWIDEFVREEIEPLDFIIASPYDLKDPVRNDIIKPLQKLVQERELWACHLGPELGGPGYGQVKLALMNEILVGPVAPQRSSELKHLTPVIAKFLPISVHLSKKNNSSNPCFETKSFRVIR